MSDSNTFNAANINWQPLDGVEHAWLSIVDVDETAKIIDVLFKFSAQEQIVLHRHVAAFNTLVIQGEHRIYSPEGELTETRPAGTYKAGRPSIEPHREGGGEEDVIILFSLRPYNNGPIYEVLDDNHNVASTMTFDDLKAIYETAA